LKTKIIVSGWADMLINLATAPAPTPACLAPGESHESKGLTPSRGEVGGDHEPGHRIRHRAHGLRF
jgi:hypothetical protein